MKKINLGCGNEKLEGWETLDYNEMYNPDYIFDLNSGKKLPFEDNVFDEVRMSHVLEHIDKPDILMNEIWRICKPNAKVTILVPYFGFFTAYGDLTHRHYYSSAIFKHYELTPGYHGKNVAFKTEKVSFQTWEKGKPLFVALGKFISLFTNVSIVFTEILLSKFLPVTQISIILKVIKENKR